MAATATKRKSTKAKATAPKRGPGRPRKHPVPADSTVAALAAVAEGVTAEPAEEVYAFQNFDLSIKIGHRKEMNLRADDIDTFVDLFQMIGEDEGKMLSQLRDTFEQWNETAQPGFKIGFTVQQGNLSIAVNAQKRLVK
jgi:hypothetical protein